MTAYQDYIGSAHFRHNLVITSDVPMMSGYARVTLAGEIVTVTVPRWSTKTYETYAIDVSFNWESSTVRKQLLWAWGYGEPVFFRADWLSGQCLIDPKQGVYNVRHPFGDDIRLLDMRGTASDYWNGKIKLLVLAGTVYY